MQSGHAMPPDEVHVQSGMLGGPPLETCLLVGAGRHHAVDDLDARLPAYRKCSRLVGYVACIDGQRNVRASRQRRDLR